MLSPASFNAGITMNFPRGSPPYITSSRPIGSWTLHRVARCSSLHPNFFLDFRSFVYACHNLSNRSLLMASSMPLTRSSAVRSFSQRVAPVSDAPIARQVREEKRCFLPISIVCSFAFVIPAPTFGNTSVHKYSVLSLSIAKTPSYMEFVSIPLCPEASDGLSGYFPRLHECRNISNVDLPVPGGSEIASISSLPSIKSCMALHTPKSCRRLGIQNRFPGSLFHSIYCMYASKSYGASNSSAFLFISSILRDTCLFASRAEMPRTSFARLWAHSKSVSSSSRILSK